MTSPVTSVKGIGSAAAGALAKIGITSAEALASMTVEQLAQVPGFSATSATRVIAEAGKLLAANPAAGSEGAAGMTSSVAPSATAPQPGTPVKDKGKGKDKRKGKGKGKSGKTKGVDRQGEAARPEAAIPRKAVILIKVLTNEIESKKAKIAKHRRKLERLERALRELLVKYHGD